MTAGSSGLFRSPAVQLALSGVRSAVAEAGCVLICGEPGTGRETLARAIHEATNGGSTSPEALLQYRGAILPSTAPFIVADCATERDVESRLFGPPTATNTDASLETLSAASLLRLAHGGTLFLRVVQDLPGRIQNRLARVLRDGEVWLDDGEASRVVAVEARIIASVDSGFAREGGLLVPELKKRLAVHRIELPPLRHRREDIPDLVRLMVAEMCGVQQTRTKSVSSQAVALLCALPWRGNLLELRALLQTLVTNVPGRRIRVDDVLTHVRLDAGDVAFSTSGTLKEARERFERDYVAAVLKQHHGRMAQAARVLGIQRTNLYRKVRQLAVARTAAVPQKSDRRVESPDQNTAAGAAELGARHARRHIVNSEEDSMEVR